MTQGHPDQGAFDNAVTITNDWQSIIATEWVLALGPHLHFLVSSGRPWAPSHEPKSGWENAHSMAAIVMSTFAIESFAGRVGRPDEDALDILLRVADGDHWVSQDHVREVFVLRNVLVHGHVWQIRDELTITPDATSAIRTIVRELSRGHTNKKYVAIVDQDRGCTKPRGLHVIPSYIGRNEASAVLSTNLRLADLLAGHDVENMRSIGDTRLVESGGATLRGLTERLGGAIAAGVHV